MLDIEKLWIEGAARAMYSRALQQRVDAAGITCSWCSKVATRPDGEFHRSEDVRSHAATPFSDAPLPADIRLQAARLMGMIEQANGAKIAAIVEVASSADCRFRDTDGAHHHPGTNSAAGWTGKDECDLIDARDFGYYLAMEAMGTGVRWSDEHAKVMLPSPRYRCHGRNPDPCGNAVTCTVCYAPLVVPRFELTTEQGEPTL